MFKLGDKPELIPRKQAKAAGIKRYFNGKPCKNGHIAERLVSSCECVLCGNNRIKIYFATPNGRASKKTAKAKYQASAKGKAKKRVTDKRYERRKSLAYATLKEMMKGFQCSK